MLKEILLLSLLIPISQFAFAEEIPDYNKPYAPISFNKSIYGWTDKVEITIFAPSWNTGKNDAIGYSSKCYKCGTEINGLKCPKCEPNFKDWR